MTYKDGYIDALKDVLNEMIEYLDDKELTASETILVNEMIKVVRNVTVDMQKVRR